MQTDPTFRGQITLNTWARHMEGMAGVSPAIKAKAILDQIARVSAAHSHLKGNDDAK